MDPFILLRWPVYWMKFWYKKVGPKWFWLGMGAGTLLAVVLNYAT